MTSIQTDLTTANAAVFVTDSSVVKRYPTTEAQLEIWLSSTQNPGASCAYNEISTLEFNGSLDTAMFQVALEKLVERHESLRSFISSDGREVVVRKAPQFAFDLFDWTADSEATIQATAREIVRSFANTPFDLQNGPLLRVAVQKLSNEKYRATIVAHHIVIDGWSLGVFVRDLGVIYDSLVGVGTEDLPDAPTYIAYADKMESYLRSDQGKADEQYWVSQFQDDIPVLDLPVTSQRPTLRTYDSLRHDHWLSPELVASVRKIGAKSGCSLFGAIFTAFQSYLSRMTGNDDLCLGIPTAGQPAMDMPNLLGHCVNTLPLRAQIDLGDSYVERMKTTRTQMLDAFDHQRYSYGTLLRKLAPTRDP
ncbi:MAG: condensation domain-containing protein, partial [Rubripirellula sp.]